MPDSLTLTLDQQLLLLNTMSQNAGGRCDHHDCERTRRTAVGGNDAMEGIARAAQIYAQEIRGQRYIEMEKEARVSVCRERGLGVWESVKRRGWLLTAVYKFSERKTGAAVGASPA